MKHVLSFFLLLPYLLNAQNLHERTWFFGQGHSLQFNNGIAVPGGVPPPVIANDYNNTGNGRLLTNIAISNNKGDLQFLVQIEGYINNVQANDYAQNKIKIFDRTGRPFPNGKIFANNRTMANTTHAGNPLAVPYPGKPSKYILFYNFENSIRYSVIDMNLNNGYGDVEALQKDIVLTGFNSIIGYKTAIIPGCDGLWLVARSITSSQYYSFKIDQQGVQMQPIISNVGNYPVSNYEVVIKIAGSVLKASNNGLQMAAATDAGVELYDFEPCSGQLKNARIIDTLPAFGLCFSPDDSKLYASYDGKRWQYEYQGEIYQYDLHQPNIKAIAASRTLVMRNPIYEVMTPFGPFPYCGPLGELKLGLDQKIYVSKNNYLTFIENWPPGICYVLYLGPDHDPVPLPASNNCIGGQYMHVIHQPNNAGMGCLPELDFLKLNDRIQIPGYLLQSDIKIAPAHPPDTLPGHTIPVQVCFEQTAILSAPKTVSCPLWDNGSTETDRVVTRSGTYWLQYAQGCTYYTDTFKVVFTPLPEVPQLQYGCPEKGMITIKQPLADKTFYTYTLSHQNNAVPLMAKSNTGYQFSDLTAGAYQLRIQAGGCDTTLELQLAAYPAPEVHITPGDTTIRYGDTLSLQAYGAAVYQWWPGPFNSAANNAAVRVWPRKLTEYLAAGRNDYGCVDTAWVRIDIDYHLPDLLPNAFSPNGDGQNDVFGVSGITYQKVVYLRVFNRLGQAVYTGFHKDAAWDGTYNGQPCDVGTYYYQVCIAYPDGRQKISKGDVLLLR